MDYHPRASRSFPLRPVLLAVALTCAAGAQAQTSPYYIGASQGFTHDSNVFRDPSSRSDNVSNTGLLGGIDQPFGRQRLFADASVQLNRYNRHSELNNTSYSLTTGLDWATVERLSGNLNFNSRQNLADLGLAIATPGGAGQKNIERTQQAVASVRWGATSRLGLDGSAEHRRVSFSNDVARAGEYTENVGGAGVRFGSSEQLSFRLGGRVSKADFPHYIDAANPSGTLDKLDRKDVDLSVVWVAGAFTTVNARISSTRENHTVAPDFSGTTGMIGVDYKLTGKTALKASVARDTGSETTFLVAAPGALPFRVDNNRLSTLTALGATYEATSKISVQADYRRTNGTTNGGIDDNTSTLAVGVTYQASRAISLGCNASHEKRENAYNDYTAGCLAKITLR
jgi:hypothetical protein